MVLWQSSLTDIVRSDAQGLGYPAILCAQLIAKKASSIVPVVLHLSPRLVRYKDT